MRKNKEKKAKNTQNVKIAKNIDKTTEKYKVALKLVNSMLKNMNKPQITDLTEFRDINREDIIIDANKQLILDMGDEIWAHYDKNKCGYYRKTPAWALNILRGMMRELGLCLSNGKKEKTTSVGVRKLFILYTIS
jgi:hypothetical protein